MKKIKTKIMLSINMMVLAAVLLTGGVASIMSYRSTVTSLEETLTVATQLAANQMAAEIRAYVNLVQEFAYNSVLLEGGTKKERLEQLHSLEEISGFAAVRLVEADGTDLESGENIADQAYFQELKKTMTPQVSEPTLSDHSEMLIYINMPMQKDGKFAGMVMGGIKASIFSDLVANIKVGQGDCTILDKDGNVIAYHDFSQVEEKFNSQLLAQQDASLKGLAALESKMVNGESGFGGYSYEGRQELMAFCPIPESNGWSISVAVMRDEFLAGMVQSLYLIGGVMIAVLVVSVFVAIGQANRISKPIVSSAQRLAALAEGDLKSQVTVVMAKDETGLLSESLVHTVEDLRQIIGDITIQLDAMAQGDFTGEIVLEYKGDFLPIKESMLHIAKSLNLTLGQIDIAAGQVSSGSDQVAAGAQALSQGATEQASSVEQLAATISEISEQVKKNAVTAHQARSRVDQMSGEMTASNEQMNRMMCAMEEISAASTEIGKIIKTIEDIAFQTNILALNAAVEAARAGTAGKGFAVVADEVRNLANKSQEASKNTAELIENALQAVGNGTHIAGETAQTLLQAVEDAEKVTKAIGEINDASTEQAQALEQINGGVDQIASVVQTNSATAEESAAASEELSGQANLLKDLLSRFTLRT